MQMLQLFKGYHYETNIIYRMTGDLVNKTNLKRYVNGDNKIRYAKITLNKTVSACENNDSYAVFEPSTDY